MTEGRVEIYFNGVWLSVCGYTWDPLDAAVTCRQLGYADALRTYSSSTQNNFGLNAARKWDRRPKCNGDERNLIDCQHDSGFEMDPAVPEQCGRTYAVAGVVCTNDSGEALPRGTCTCIVRLVVLIHAVSFHVTYI